MTTFVLFVIRLSLVPKGGLFMKKITKIKDYLVKRKSMPVTTTR